MLGLAEDTECFCPVCVPCVHPPPLSAYVCTSVVRVLPDLLARGMADTERAVNGNVL